MRAEGAKNAVVTFTTPQGQVSFTKVGGFTVGEASSGGFTNGPASAGYNLFSPINSTNTYLMDNDGNIVKTWSSSYTARPVGLFAGRRLVDAPGQHGKRNVQCGRCRRTR